MPIDKIELLEFSQVHRLDKDKAQILQFDDVQSAKRFLQRYQHDGFAMRAFRTRLFELGNLSLHQMKDRKVIDYLAQALVSHRLFAVGKNNGFKLPPAARKTEETTTESDQDAPVESIAPKDVDWIEVQLLDQNLAPVAGQKFDVTTVDGKTESATTNYQGLGRIMGIKYGNCQVQFSKIDKDLWGRKGSPAIGKISQRKGKAKTHEVAQGDTLATIADEHNTHWRLIWDHPDNAELKEKRQEPYVLMPGDKLQIPEMELKQEPGATMQRHVFQTGGAPLEESLLRIDYQFVSNNSDPLEDVITLTHKESDWEYAVAAKDLRAFDENWVALIFENVPQTGTFDLIQDTHDGEDPHYMLSDCSYEELCAQDDEDEVVKIAEDDSEDEIAA